jgi:hypothetical protein
MAQWFLKLSGNEKLKLKLVLFLMSVIIGLLLYIIFSAKEIEFFVDTEYLSKTLIKVVHCPVCHPKGF